MRTEQIPNNMIFKGYRYKLYPTEEQKEFIDKCIHVNRYIYNWAIEEEEKQYAKYKNGSEQKALLTIFDLDKRFTTLRSTHEFVAEVPHNSARSSIRRVVKAYRRFFEKQNKKPRFKSKKNQETLSYNTRPDRFYIENNKIQIEGMPGKYVDIKFDSGFTRESKTKYYNTVVSKDKIGNYYIGFTVLVEKDYNYIKQFELKKGKAIGIDLNKNNRFVLSTGETFKAPSIEKELRKIKRLHRKLNKDYDRAVIAAIQERTNLEDFDSLYSNRHFKRLKTFRKYYRRIHNVNKNFINTTCKRIIEMNPEKGFVMEKLDNTNSIFNKHYIAKQMVFTNFYSIRIRMEELCNTYGIPFKLASQFYPSSQICSSCGHKQKIYSHKEYHCPVCGLTINRDLNAAINLEKLAYEI